MAAGIVAEPEPRGHGQDAVCDPLCAWVYAGSHNLSGAAWGKVEETEDRQELVMMSYEIGVPSPRRSPAHKRC